MLGIAFQPVGFNCPRYLCLRSRNQNGNHVKVAEVDVSKYKPSEVDCKVEDGKVLVSGKHRVETEHGYETSEFQRAYNLPENVDPSSVKTTVQDGVMKIEAAKQQNDREENQDDKKLSLKINLGRFKPEEVNVRLKGNELVVTGEHKNEQEGLYTSRHFKQYFTLPSEVDPSTLVSILGQDGVLRIEAEKKPTLAIEERDIEVKRDEEMTEDTEK